MPVLHRYLAHRQAHERENAQKLFAARKVMEIWRLSTFLVLVHSALWDLLHNGRKPVLKAIRHSPKRIYSSRAERTSPHERIVRDAKKLMKFILTATHAR